LKRVHGGDIWRAAEESGRLSGELIDFSSNINPYGPPSGVDKVIVASLKGITHYPDPESRKLRGTLADYLGASSPNILVGNGSVDLIHFLANRFRPCRALIPSPTFCEYELAVKSAGGEVVHLVLGRGDFSLDVEMVLERLSGVKMVFLCNPNNPTGNLFPRDRLELVAEEAERLNVTIVVDEAFMDFLEDRENHSLIKEAVRRKNVLVLGSLTKFFALPGLRLGYVLAGEDLIAELAFHKEPWSVNHFAQVAGIAALKDEEFISMSRKLIAKERKSLYEDLLKLDRLKPYPSKTNFILVELEHPAWSSIRLREELAKRAIMIRDCSSFRGLGEKFIRVAVRDEVENGKLVDALKQVLMDY